MRNPDCATLREWVNWKILRHHRTGREHPGASVERAMGVLLVITGIGFLTGAVSNESIWLSETFPGLQNFG
jgi:hypothetical protein